MKLKTYFVSALVLASTLIGFTPSTKAQDSNTRTISCNGCIESTKRQVVKDIIAYGYAQGQYRFVVINMEGGNVHEYDVSVPPQYIDDFGQSSQQPTITLIYRADQALRNQRVREARDAVKEVENAVDEFFGNIIPMPENSGFISAYDALEAKADFNTYVTHLLTEESSISSKIRDGKLIIHLMTDSLQIGGGVGFTVALTINTEKKVWITFTDGSTIQVILKLSEVLGDDWQIDVTVTDYAKDKNGDRVPLSMKTLPYYNLGHSGINESAIQSYYSSIGAVLLYDTGWTNKDNQCATTWRCSSNGKTCALIVIVDRC